MRELAASTSYCFKASVVNNSTGEESGLSNQACATTNSSPPTVSFNVTTATICGSVQSSVPYDYLDIDGSFPMSPGAKIYAWSRIGSLTSLNCQWRLYYQADNARIYNAQVGGPPSYTGTNLNYFNAATQEVTTYCEIDANSLPAWIGQYRVELWVNGILAKTMYFNLVLPNPPRPFVISNIGDSFIKLKAGLVSGANIY